MATQSLVLRAWRVDKWEEWEPEDWMAGTGIDGGTDGGASAEAGASAGAVAAEAVAAAGTEVVHAWTRHAASAEVEAAAAVCME